MFKRITAILCLCGILLLSGCTIPSNSSASILTATSLKDEVVVVRSYNGTNDYIKKVVSKRFTAQYEHYKNKGFLDCPNEEFQAFWFLMLEDMAKGMENAAPANYGYALKDINDDGVEELFFMRNDNVILAMFTYHLDNTVMLDAFYSTHKCIILKDGRVLTIITDGEGTTTYSIRSLANKGDVLENQLIVSVNGDNYYQTIDGKLTSISKEEFEKHTATLPKTNNYKLDFIPYSYED